MSAPTLTGSAVAVQVDRFRRLRNEAQELAHGSSNDEEIDALRAILNLADPLLHCLGVEGDIEAAVLAEFYRDWDNLETLQSNDDEIDALWQLVDGVGAQLDAARIWPHAWCERCGDETVCVARALCGHCAAQEG